MSIINILFRRNKYEKPAKITWKNIKKYIQGNFNKLLRKVFKIKSHREEQYVWRMEQIKEKSFKCFEDGVCRICGCDTEGLALSDPPCEGNCFPEIMNEIEWKQYKKINNIKI